MDNSQIIPEGNSPNAAQVPQQTALESQKAQNEKAQGPQQNKTNPSLSSRAYKWIKRATPLLAFAAAIFAVPKGVLDLYNGFVSKPDTKLIPEAGLVISYDPDGKMLEFTFEFTAANSGTKYDTISEISAHIEQLDRYSSAKTLFSMVDTDFEFKENGAKIQRHFPITKDSTRPITCNLNYYLADEMRQALVALEPETRRRLRVELTGSDAKPHIMDFCFDVSQKVIDSLFNSEIKGVKPFPLSECSSASK